MSFELLRDLTLNFYNQDMDERTRDILENYTSWFFIEITYLFLECAKEKYPDKEGIEECMDILANYNKYLKDNKKRYTTISEEETKKFLNKIKTYIIPYDLTLYRGTNEKWLNNTILKKDKEFKVGDILSTIIPISTSLQADVASHNCEYSEKPVILEIHLPQSFPGIWLMPLSKSKTEYEILLPSELNFEVTDTSNIEITEENNKIVYKKISLEYKGIK